MSFWITPLDNNDSTGNPIWRQCCLFSSEGENLLLPHPQHNIPTGIVFYTGTAMLIMPITGTVMPVRCVMIELLSWWLSIRKKWLMMIFKCHSYFSLSNAIYFPACSSCLLLYLWIFWSILFLMFVSHTPLAIQGTYPQQVGDGWVLSGGQHWMYNSSIKSFCYAWLVCAVFIVEVSHREKTTVWCTLKIHECVI